MAAIILLLSCCNLVWNNLYQVTCMVSAPSLNTFKGRLDKYCMGTSLLFSGSERVCTKTSEQPTGHSGLTSKAEEECFMVSRFQHQCSCTGDSPWLVDW